MKRFSGNRRTGGELLASGVRNQSAAYDRKKREQGQAMTKRKVLTLQTPYLLLLESLLRWFESRGEHGAHARYAASIAVSVLVLINIVTLMLFAYGLWGVRWIGVLKNIPLSIVVIFALVALHWRIIGRIQSGDLLPSYAGGNTATKLRVPIWVVYLVTSILLLFAGTLLATRF